MGQQPVNNGSTAPHPLGELIRHERERRGLTRRELAEKVRRAGQGLGTNEKAVARWELRGDTPQPAALRALAAVLEVPVEQLVARARQPAGGAISSTPDALLLQAPPADHEYVAGVRETVQQLVNLEVRLGGDELAPVATCYLRTAQRRLSSGRYERGVEHDLQAAVGELAELAGWLLHDAGQQEAARAMNHEALHLTRLAGDRSMELLILGNASLQAIFTRTPGEALMIANAVLEAGDLTNREHVIFKLRQARALAQLGERDAALRGLDEAQAAFWDGASSRDPAWAWWVDPAEVRAHVALAHGDLGDAATAAALLQRSVEDCPPRRLGARFIYLAQQLRALVEAGAWSDAETVVGQLLPYVGEVHSGRTRGLLREGIERIEGAPASPALHEAGHHLRAVLTTAPPSGIQPLSGGCTSA